MDEPFDLHNPPQPRDRLIVALDVATRDEARAVVESLEGSVSFFKVGYQLFVAEGMDIVRALVNAGKRVFLDLKMDDIEETITLAVREIAKNTVSFLTVFGNGATVRAAKTGRGTAAHPKILQITALTSVSEQDLIELGFIGPDKPLKTIDEYVHWRAQKSMDAECDGLIAAGSSVAALHAKYPQAIIVTPGVRPAGAGTDDHKRPTTPRAAIAAGSTYLVVGRPIRDAANPRQMADQIIDDIRQGLVDRQRQSMHIVR
jgi:orotidine-5'-phosphate decarboxylase